MNYTIAGSSTYYIDLLQIWASRVALLLLKTSTLSLGHTHGYNSTHNLITIAALQHPDEALYKARSSQVSGWRSWSTTKHSHFPGWLDLNPSLPQSNFLVILNKDKILAACSSEFLKNQWLSSVRLLNTFTMFLKLCSVFVKVYRLFRFRSVGD